MKNTAKFLPLIAFVVIVIIGGCKKNTPAPANNTTVFTPKDSCYIVFNNTYWGGDTLHGFTSGSGLSIATIGAIKSDHSHLEIYFPVSAASGTLNMNQTDTYVLYYDGKGGVYQSASGSMIITSNANNRASGTFTGSFASTSSSTVSGTFTATQGGFKGPY